MAFWLMGLESYGALVALRRQNSNTAATCMPWMLSVSREVEFNLKTLRERFR